MGCPVSSWTRKLALALLLLSGGCGPGLKHPSPTPVDFTQFYLDFQLYSAEYGNSVPSVDNLLAIGFGPTDDAETAGECIWNFVAGRKIVINQSEWEGLTDDSRESLVFHELGHCVLHRGHNPDTISGLDAGITDGSLYPKSLMNPTFVDGGTYRLLQDYYLNELFNGN